MTTSPEISLFSVQMGGVETILKSFAPKSPKGDLISPPFGGRGARAKTALALFLILFSGSSFMKTYSQGLVQANGNDIAYTMRRFGVQTNNPVLPFEVNGSGKFYKNLFVDSLITSWHIQTQQIEAGTATITGDLTAQKLTVTSTVLFNSLSGSGNGLVGVDTSGTLKRFNMTGNATDYFRGDGTFGNLSSATGWQLVGGTLVSTVNDVAVPGTLSVGHSINIGSFRFKNSALINEDDTVITDRNIRIMTLADKIALEADTVTMREFTRVGSDTSKYAPPVTGKLALEVAGSATVTGDLAVKGTVSSDAVKTNNVVANKIESKELTADSLRVQNKTTLGFLHVKDSIKIGNSIWLGGKDQNTGTNNKIYSDDDHLFIQSSAFNYNTIINAGNMGRVGVGTSTPQAKLHIKGESNTDCATTLRLEHHFTGSINGCSWNQPFYWDFQTTSEEPSDPQLRIYSSFNSTTPVLTLNAVGNFVGIGTISPSEKLEVAGDIKASGLAGTNSRMVIADATGKLATLPLSGTGNPNWSITGNSGTTAGTNYIGTNDAEDFVIKTIGFEKMRIMGTGTHPGNMGLGTNDPQKKLHIKTTHFIGGAVSDSNDADASHQGIRLENWVNANSSIWDIEPMVVDATTSHLSFGTPGNSMFSISSSGNIKASGLAGTDNRMVIADATGKLATLPLSGTGNPNWSVMGNSGTTAGTNYIGTADAVDFVVKTTNTERMRVTSTGLHPGLVGIGTNAPEKMLHIKTLHTYDNSDPIAPCWFTNPIPPGCTIPFETLPAATQSHGGIRLEDGVSLTAGTLPHGTFDSKWDIYPEMGYFFIKNPGSSSFPFSINSANQVGINTPNPGNYNLDVNGSLNATQFFLNGQQMLDLWQAGAGSDIYYNSGKVGVGTTLPLANLQITGSVSGDKANVLALDNTGVTDNSGTALYMGYQPAGLGLYGARILQRGYPSSTRSSDLLFQIHGTPADNLDASWLTALMIQRTTGNVGIGTTSIQKKLEVNNGGIASPNGIRISSYVPTLYFQNQVYTDGHDWHISVAEVGTNATIAFKDETANTYRMVIDGDGEVGIGTTSPMAKMHIDVVNTTDKAFSVSQAGAEQFKIMGNGNLYATRLWTQTPPFPDFVLSKSYKRPTWQEKENYYWQFGRLMYMSSAEEVAKNGLDVSSGFVGLTQNVEENSLDINELFKRMEKIEFENGDLKKENKELKKEIESLKRKITKQ